jgi:hypothetical protein
MTANWEQVGTLRLRRLEEEELDEGGDPGIPAESTENDVANLGV